jgi:4-nitrophenyl phosphatase
MYSSLVCQIEFYSQSSYIDAIRYNLDPKKTCMIGDRLDTDIDFGNRGGLTTLCVLTGVTSESKLLSDSNPIKATYYVDAFGDFASLAK